MEIIVDRSLRHWWVFLIRGILFIALGIYMAASPASSYAALGFLLGVIILLAGITELLHVVQNKNAVNRGWHLAIGLIDLILGIILVGHISASETILRIVVGIWFLFKGISLLSFSGIVGRSIPMIIGGIVLIIFAIFTLFNPTFGALTIIFWTAFAFMVTGIMNILLAVRLRAIEQRY